MAENDSDVEVIENENSNDVPVPKPRKEAPKSKPKQVKKKKTLHSDDENASEVSFHSNVSPLKNCFVEKISGWVNPLAPRVRLTPSPTPRVDYPPPPQAGKHLIGLQGSDDGDEFDADVPTIAATRERRERKPINYNFDDGSDENEEKSDEMISDEEKPTTQKKPIPPRKPKKIADDSDGEFQLDSDIVKKNFAKKFFFNFIKGIVNKFS